MIPKCSPGVTHDLGQTQLRKTSARQLHRLPGTAVAAAHGTHQARSEVPSQEISLKTGTNFCLQANNEYFKVTTLNSDSLIMR